MTTTLQVAGTNPPANQMIPTEHEMLVFNTMAKQAVASQLYRGIGTEAAVMMNMLAARELGLPPMLALNGGLNVINGKMEISARAMNAMIRRAGHSLQEKVSNETECTLVGTRRDNGDTCTATFSIDEAKQAGLIKTGGGWTKWPKDMLYARCLSRLARRLFADVIGVGYIEGEISDPGASSAFSRPSTAQEEIPNADWCEVDPKEDPNLQMICSGFEEPKASWMREYLLLVHERQKISLEKIREKYFEDPYAALEKFDKWVQKNKIVVTV